MSLSRLQIERLTGLAASAVLLLAGCGTASTPDPGPAEISDNGSGATRTVTIQVADMSERLKLL